MADMKVKAGVKIEPTELAKIKKDEIGQGHPVPQKMEQSDVEGQEWIRSSGLCPHCGAVNHFWEDTENWNYYNCWYCYGAFKA